VVAAAEREAVHEVSKEEEFRGLFDAGFTYVWNTLRRLGVPPADREDLANEVFFRVHRTLHSYDRERPLKPWLFAFAFRVASDYRRLARHRFEVPLAESDSRGGPQPDEALEQADLRAIVLAALESVDLEKRAVLILHDLDDEPIPEIARALGIPEGTAYSRLRAGRAQFTAAVQREQLRRRER
jgi:RNA polymerase sigma-70 factor (ECF subfamily)